MSNLEVYTVFISPQDNSPGLTLYVNGSQASASNNQSMSWPFATADAAEGHYECRWPNGSFFGSRSVTVQGRFDKTLCTCTNASLGIWEAIGSQDIQDTF